MKPRIYIETTVPSYLVARPSRDLILAGQQEATREWWEQSRQHYEVFVSEFVEIEAARGDAEMAAARLRSIQEMPRLPLTENVQELTAAILATGLIPAKAAVDASHIAVAAVHEVDILLTWNCKHIHNISISRKVERVCTLAGYSCPAICTPFDLLET